MQANAIRTFSKIKLNLHTFRCTNFLFFYYSFGRQEKSLICNGNLFSSFFYVYFRIVSISIMRMTLEAVINLFIKSSVSLSNSFLFHSSFFLLCHWMRLLFYFAANVFGIVDLFFLRSFLSSTRYCQNR